MSVLDGTFERPYTEIRVRHRERSRRYMVLVYSGADINVFSADLAAALGIDLERGEPLIVRGATGQSETLRWALEDMKEPPHSAGTGQPPRYC
jgi:Aspartyl protease